MKHTVFRQFFRDFCSAAIYPAVFLLSLALLVLLSASCSRRDEGHGGKVGSGDYITFTATGGTPSAITKSSADSSSENEVEQTYTIYYDFEKGENVASPQGGVSYDSDGNLTQSSDTRFSGEVFETTVSGVYAEYLDWVEGDKITIAQKGDPGFGGNGYLNLFSDYEIKNPTRKADPKRSTATLTHVTGNPLQWRDGETNYFAALYPSAPDLGLTVVATTVGGPFYKASFSGIYEVMPSTQYCTLVGSRNYQDKTGSTKAETWYAPNMRYAYMAAGASGVSSSGTPLTLSFYPQFSSVEVKLLKPSSLQEYPVKLTGAVLTGGNGASDAASLSGSPQMTRANASGLEVIGGSAPSITHTPATATYGSSIMMKFKKSDGTTDEPELNETTPVSFTFLMLPASDLNQLELTLTLAIGGVESKKKLKLKDANGWIRLPGGKKLTVTNFQAPVVDVTPLIIEPINAGTTTITINNPNGLTYKYSIDGAAKVSSTANPVTITANKGEKVALYQNNSARLGEEITNANPTPPGIINFSSPCYVYGNVMSLAGFASALTVPQQFASLFKDNTNLRTHETKPILLPATTLQTGCYRQMFYGCTGLTSVPTLPATTVKASCYQSMFYGCTGLITVPTDYLPATTLAEYCYESMFRGCSNLTTAPSELPATNLSGAQSCYSSMFLDCTNLTTAPSLPATTLETYCYRSMFQGCTGLTSAPSLSAKNLKNFCYAYMFQGCTGLTSAPALPATNLAAGCYNYMFRNCTNLTTLPDPKPEYEDYLPATTLKASCYQYMFANTGLTTAPSLPATTMASRCYDHMFYDCTDLTTVPMDYLSSVTTLAERCYESMFSRCTELATAPSLPVNELVTGCYQSMFSGCTKLVTAPSLPATDLASSCYKSMFSGCIGLTAAPSLPATTLASSCYWSMFSGCTGLTTAPSLPATTLVFECYFQMFHSCSSLNYIKCMATDMSATDCLTRWVSGVASTGKFVRHPDTKVATTASTDTWAYPSISGIPDGWLETGYNFPEKNFTVSEDGQKVKFAPGNLQAVIAEAGSARNARWQFADRQYDSPKKTTRYTAEVGDVVDLFMHPESTTGNYAFGIPVSNAYSPATSTFVDWGVYLDIYPNSDLTSTPYAKNTYRTLTIDEWNYLLNIRESGGATVGNTIGTARYSKITLNVGGTTGTVFGILIYPDDFTWDATTMGSVPPNVNSPTSNFSTSSYTLAEFRAMEAEGAVFLPVLGYIQGDGSFAKVNRYGDDAYYWSKTVSSVGAMYANVLHFYSSNVTTLRNYNTGRSYGYSVRLVKNVN